MGRFLYRAVITAMACASMQAALADLTVQVGAYEKPATANLDAARGVGQVYLLPGADGLSRLLVGRYDSTEQAKSALRRLRAVGYRDAFITRAAGISTTYAPGRAAAPPQRQRRWEHVPEKLRMKLVLLDGQPYIKDGDVFTPLSQY